MRRLQLITNSELTTYRACPLKHRFRYTELLRPQIAAAPLRAGDMMHKGIAAGWFAAWLERDEPPELRLSRALPAALETMNRELELFRQSITGHEREQELLDEAAEAHRIMSWAVPHYFERRMGDLACVPVAIEQSFRIRAPNAAGTAGLLEFAGQIDLVLWDRGANRIIVEDHKSTATGIEALEGKLLLDTQLTGYVAAMKRLRQNNGTEGWNTTRAAQSIIRAEVSQFVEASVGSVAWNVLRKKVPEQPKINLLKKGSVQTSHQAELLELQAQDNEPRGEVSVRAIDTTPERYKEALEEQFYEREIPITEKQREVLDGLKRKANSFFGKLEAYRSPDELERWRQELWVEARRIRQAESDKRLATRNPLACTGIASPRCEYEAVCTALDDLTVRREFRIAETKHEELHADEKEDGQEGNEEDGQEDGGYSLEATRKEVGF